MWLVEIIQKIVAVISAEWLVALTALAAVIVSPLISMYIVKKQIRASVVSSNRQVWINTLRDQIAEFVAIITFINIYKKKSKKKMITFSKKESRLYSLNRKLNFS